MNPFITIRLIAAITCDCLQISMPKLFSKSRDRECVFARYIIIELGKKYLQTNYKEFIREFKFSDHTVIVHARQEHSKLSATNNAIYTMWFGKVENTLQEYLKRLS